MLVHARAALVDTSGMSRRSWEGRRAVSRAAVCASVFAAAIAVAWPGADAFGASRSSPAGLTLIASVDRAYTHVPAAIITVSGAGQTGRFTEILKGGSVVAESYSHSDSTGTTVLVAPTGSPTYAKEPHTSCWRTLARSIRRRSPTSATRRSTSRSRARPSGRRERPVPAGPSRSPRTEPTSS